MKFEYKLSLYKFAIISNLQWLKNILKKNKEFKLDIIDIHDCFGIKFTGETPETIYKILKEILSKEGIEVYTDKYIDKYDRLVFTLNEEHEENNRYYKGKKKYKQLCETDQSFITILKDNKLYEDDSGLLLCPNCLKYSVDYFKKRYDWWCNNCMEFIDYSEYILDLSDEDKYHIYKLFGLDALSILTNEKLKNIKGFVASYFKKSCITRKEKCLYFDFLKDSE